MIDPHYLIQFSQSNDIYRNEACIQGKILNTFTYDSYQICSSPLNSFQHSIILNLKIMIKLEFGWRILM
jgi:hypothetical protein